MRSITLKIRVNAEEKRELQNRATEGSLSRWMREYCLAAAPDDGGSGAFSFEQARHLRGISNQMLDLLDNQRVGWEGRLRELIVDLKNFET